ncbi:MAG: hypothetical protein H7Z75_16665 [Ferruginibacter sp.]|nr:hypothetical protein [Cytophagales bacterium]
MKLRIVFILAIFASLLLPAYAQQDYASDALLYSGSSLSGTARFQGLGGAQTALGADLGSLSGNPAGLGMYKKSEWSVSPALGYAGTSAAYIGNTTREGKLAFSVPNVGVVFSSAKEETAPGKWRGGAFGVSFSRQNSFQNRYAFDGINNVSSIADRFAFEANERGASVNTLRNEYDFNSNTTSSPYDGGATALYFQTYLVNPVGTNDVNNNEYFQFEAQDEPEGSSRTSVRQQKTLTTTGSASQWNIAYGGNYDDKLYFGASLGIARLNYQSINKYDESYVNGKVFRGLTLNQDFNIRGTGANFTAGVIYRANDVFRLGASFTTPTVYGLSETYDSSVDVDRIAIPKLDYNGNQEVDNQGRPLFVDIDPTYTVRTAPRSFNYNLTTPFKASGGVAFFLGKGGFISADVEYIPYNTMKLRTDGDASFKTDFEQGNLALGITGIQQQFQSVINFKVGGEFRYNILRLRGGFAYQADPYKPSPANNLDHTRLNFSLGGGVRLPNYYIDLATTYSRYKSANTPYTLPDNSSYASALIRNQFTNVVVTFGTFF